MRSAYFNMANDKGTTTKTGSGESVLNKISSPEHHHDLHHTSSHPEQNTSLSTLIKKETGYIMIIAAVFLVGFKVLFYKESVEVIARTIGGIFWMSIVAGFPIMYYWHRQLNFLERITLGGVLGLGLSTVTAYYLSFAGVGLKLSAFLLPPLFGVVGSVIIYFRFFRR